MKFITYSHNKQENYGLLNTNISSVIPMDTILDKLGKKTPRNLLEFIHIYSDTLVSDFQRLFDSDELLGIPLDNVKLLSPIPYPRRNVFCLGKNYADHALEVDSLPSEKLGKSGIPDNPIYFTKVADPAIGNKDKIIIPKEYTNKLDYEVELAIIIGKDGKNIPYAYAQDYIFGYTIGNDVSARDVQSRHIQWFKGKSLDTATSIGPWIVHKSEICYPVELDISCKVNDEVLQNSNTKHLIFDIPTIISDLSQGLTLRAGDIILTGTPAGVGMGMNPPRFLKSGDVVECYVEKIGTLINYVQ